MRIASRYFVAALFCCVPGDLLAGEIVEVDMSSLAFSPAHITIRRGESVKWVNKDFIDHTATGREGNFDLVVPAG
jgi:plastocyanin